ncbi:uncharacterized protein EURHEDRAFT_411963, partial [Aspergillus ruber CBS 135680]
MLAKPRYWNQAAFANYLGGSEDEIATVRRGLVQLMKSYDAIHKSFKTKAAKNGLKELLLLNLDKLLVLVRDAHTNDVRLEGLMGLAYKVNNSHKQYGREKMAFIITNKPPAVRDNDENDGNDDGDESSSEESGEEEDSSDGGSSTGNGPGIHKFNDQLKREVNDTRNRDTPSESRGHERIRDIRSDHSISHSRSHSRANHSSPAVVLNRDSAAEPPNKRMRPSEPLAPLKTLSGPFPSFPQYQKPSYNLPVRNIWVVNEVDNESHGLCPIMELVKKDTDKNNLQLSDLDFDHWLLIVQAHCGYDYSIHRLEYRPSATITLPLMIGRSFTVPMRTPSQWRGALNSLLQAKPDQDPVFHLVSQC